MMSTTQMMRVQSAHSAVRSSARRRLGLASTGALLILLAGCGALPVAPVSPQLELLSSRPLTFAAGCQATGTFRVDFAVLEDGTVSAVKPSSAPSCVQDGLATWVQSFRYAPTGVNAAIPHAVEWLMVSAPRG